MTIRYLDPTVTSQPTATQPAPRVADLDGRVVGLLANAKANGDRLLELVAEELKARYRLRGLVTRAKDDASRPAPAELIDEMARTADVVVTAIGD